MVKLYHATPYPDTFTVINPGTRNVAIRQTDIGSVADAVTYDEKNTPYVYASDNHQMAATYAITKGVRLGNMSLPDGELVYVEKESIIGDSELKGGIYSFESDYFLPLYVEGQATNQWVSAHHVDLKKAEYQPLRSLNDIMQIGVQVLQIAENPAYTSYDFYLEMSAQKDYAETVTLVQTKIKSGDLRWLNEERGIRPSALLIESKAIEMPQGLQRPNLALTP